MDLREKPGKLQIFSEWCIRFRLPLIFLLGLLWALMGASWQASMNSLLVLSNESAALVRNFALGNFSQVFPAALFAGLMLFVVRFWLFGWKQGFLWLAALVFSALLFVSLETASSYEYIVVAGVLGVAATLLVFVRTVWAQGLLPWLLLAYTFSAWLFALGVTNLCYGGLMALFMADTASYWIETGKNLRAKKSRQGALVAATRKVLPVVFASAVFLALLDAVFFYAKLPLLGADEPHHSIALYSSYLLWMPLFSTALYSFFPFERTVQKKR
jgi:hypothetical protein